MSNEPIVFQAFMPHESLILYPVVISGRVMMTIKDVGEPATSFEMPTDQARALGLALVGMTEVLEGVGPLAWRDQPSGSSSAPIGKGRASVYFVKFHGKFRANLPTCSSTYHDTLEQAKAWCENHPWRKGGA